MGDLWGDIVSAGQSAISNAQSWGQGAASAVSNAIPAGVQEAGSAALSGLSSANQAAGKLAAAETGVIFAPAVAALGSAAIGAKLIGDARSAVSSPSEGSAGITFTKPSTDTKSSGKSGGASYTNKYASQKGGGTANWIEPISTRPGFRKTEDLGLDTKTWSLISEGNTPLQAVTMRLQEETKPSVRRELEWQQTQLSENKVEVSSDYHNWAKSTGKSVSINPFENEGDRALALMQGTGQESKLQISKSNPSVSELFSDLPGGSMGLNDRNWESAKTGYTQKSPDFSKAVDWVEAARYDPGVYGSLNSNRNYDAWNKARPGEQVKVISTDELLYGTPRSHKYTDEIGYFGRKTESVMPKSHIKKYDKTITETLFGSRSVHKSGRRKEVRGLKGTEWNMLDELGVKRPTHKKSQTSLREDIHYTRSKSSFQSMQKPNTSVRKVVVDEMDILMGEGMFRSKKQTKKPKKAVNRKGVN